MTEWRWVPGFEGLYAISDDGRLRSHHRTPEGRELRGGITRDGYPTHALYCDGKPMYAHAHTLVALAFIGARPAGQVIRHLDGDPSNNRVSNLAYGTTAENIADMYRHQRARVGEASPKAKLSNEDVHMIRLAYVPGVTTMSAIAERFGVTRLAVQMIVRGRTWKWLTTPGWSPISEDGRVTRWADSA